MPALTAGELTLLRAPGHKANFYLSVSQPRTLLSAQVNNGSAARGDTAIVYDTGTGSGYADIQEGQVLKVVTATRTERVRVRSITGSQSSGTVTVTGNSILWADNQNFDILEDYPITPRPSRFTSSTFYKDWTSTYTYENSEPNPVVIAGPHRAGFLSSGSLVEDIDLTDSYAVANGASIGTYITPVVYPSTGVTINVTTGTGTITYTTAGQYWVKYQVVDSNTRGQISWRRQFVHNSTPTSSDYPYTDFEIRAFNGSWDRGGWSLQIQVNGTADTTAFPDEALIVLWYNPVYGTTSQLIGGYSDAKEVLFCGYIRRGSVRADWNNSTVTFEASTPEQMLREITTGTDVVLQAITGTPSNWTQWASDLDTLKAIHHYLRYHCTLLECTDVLLGADGVGRASAVFQKSDMYSALSQVAGQRQAKLVSDKQGRLHLVREWQLLNDSDRAASTVIEDLEEQDRIDDIEIIDRPTGDQALVFTNGFTFNGSTVSAVCAKAPGNAPYAHGAQIATVPNQVVANQTAINQLAGRLWAAAQNPYQEIRLTFNGHWLGATDIIQDEIWQLNVTSASNKRGIALTDKDVVLTDLNIRIDPVSGYAQVDGVFEPESVGPGGVAYNCLGLPGTVGEPDAPSWDSGGAAGVWTACSGGPTKYSGTDSVVEFSFYKFSSTYGMFLDFISNEGSVEPNYATRFTFSGEVVGAGASYDTGSSHAKPYVELIDSSYVLLSYIYDTGSTPYTELRIADTTDPPTLGTALNVTTDSETSSQTTVVLSTSRALLMLHAAGHIYNIGISGTTLTENDNVDLSATLSCITKISTTDAIASDTTGNAYIIQTSGTTISAGSAQVLGFTPYSLAPISSSAVVAAWTDYDALDNTTGIKVMVLSISGTTITTNTTRLIDHANDVDDDIQIIDFGDGENFGLIYEDQGANRTIRFRTFRVDGTTVYSNDDKIVVDNSDTYALMRRATYYDTGKILVPLQEDTGQSEGYYCILTQ